MLTGQVSDARPITVSLCLIVRDEAELLPRFLSAASGLWDELCVVDTGSRDATLAILRAAGAKIIERAWDGDFSAARNAGLAEAKGDFIVVLDADEMVSPEFVQEVRAWTSDPKVGAATVRMVNEMPHGRKREAQLLRVFRNDPSIRFAHRIHESVAGAVEAYLARTGLERRAGRAPIEHLGYQRDRAAARGKKARDKALLERSIAEDPNDFYSRMKLLELARFWNDEALARDVATACRDALAAAGPATLADQPWGGDLAALLATALYQPGDDQAALGYLEGLAPHCKPCAALLLSLGERHERTGALQKAVDSFIACLSFEAETADRELATVRPLMGLARIALTQPHGIEDAWTLTERALGYNPRDPEALFAAASICRLAGGPTLVDEFVRDYTTRWGETQELREALAS